MLQRTARTLAAAMLGLLCHAAHGAEDFQLRYNIAGSLGGEVFAPPDATGFVAGIAATYIDIKKVTGNDGSPLTMTLPGGTVPLPEPTPPALYPSYGAQTAVIEPSGTLKLWNLALGYITEDRYAGGRMAFGAVVPYGVRRQDVRATAATPALQWNPTVPAATQAAVAAQFSSVYQAGLAAQAAGATGEVEGLGDVELQAGWLYVTERLRVLAGGSLVLPTGRYDAAAGPDIGFGNFYTFRPAVQIGYLPTPDIALAAKLTFGFNTKNKDNDLRSGNWIGLEGAAAYKTRIGAVGLHAVYAQQVQDDSNNPWGASRFRTLNAGAFFTTMIPGVDAALTLQYMKTTDSRNAKAGDFSQLRIIKVF